MIVKRVLFVDDEEKVLHSLKRELRGQDFAMLFANSGRQALQVLENNEIHVIVADIKMPEMSGLELLKIVKEEYPDITRMVLSGYNYLGQVIAVINSGDIYKYIPKPWKNDTEFIPAIQAALEENDRKTEQRQLLKSLEKKNDLYTKMLREKDRKIELYDEKHDFLTNVNDKIKEVFQGGVPNVSSQEKDFLGWAVFNTYREYVNNYVQYIQCPSDIITVVDIKNELEKIHSKQRYEIKVIGDFNKETQVLNPKIFIWVIKSLMAIMPSINERGIILLNVVASNPPLLRIIRKIRIDPERRLDFTVLEKYVNLLNLLISEMNSRIVIKDCCDEIYVEFDHIMTV